MCLYEFRNKEHTTWLICVMRMECVYCAVRIGSLNAIQSSKRQAQFKHGPVYVHNFFFLDAKSVELNLTVYNW